MIPTPKPQGISNGEVRCTTARRTSGARRWAGGRSTGSDTKRTLPAVARTCVANFSIGTVSLTRFTERSSCFPAFEDFGLGPEGRTDLTTELLAEEPAGRRPGHRIGSGELQTVVPQLGERLWRRNFH